MGYSKSHFVAWYFAEKLNCLTARSSVPAEFRIPKKTKSRVAERLGSVHCHRPCLCAKCSNSVFLLLPTLLSSVCRLKSFKKPRNTFFSKVGTDAIRKTNVYLKNHTVWK